MTPVWRDVAASDDVQERSNRAFALGDQHILICRTGGRLFASDALCPHSYASLEGGKVTGRTLHCPLHGARFDLKSGKALGGITRLPLKLYPVRETAGMIQIGLADD